MATTLYEYWVQKGRMSALQQVLHVQLEQQFGPLSPAVRARLESLPEERLVELAGAVHQAASLR